VGWLTLAVAFRKTTDPDVRLEVAGAAREAEDLADAEQRLDRSTTGRIYISDAFDRYKVYYTAIERDARGRVTTRQRTRTFRRDAPHVTPEGGQLTAFEAAVEFKRERDLDAALEREHRTATLDETFEGYLVRRGVRPKTARDYRQQWYKYVTPTIGGYDLSNVTVTVVERWYEDLADVAQASRTKVANLLRGVLRDAYDRGEIAQNPGRVLRPPASRVRALRPDEIPTQEQVRRLADEVDERYSPLVLLLSRGMRLGEVAALRWDRVDLASRRIIVDATMSEEGGYGPPKTAAAVRTIVLPRFMVDALHAHDKRFPSEPYVFTSPAGQPLRQRNWRRRVWKPAAARAGLAHLNPHDLRHTAASTLLASGAGIGEVAQRLGHANPAITLKVYTHLIASRADTLAELEEEAWSA
jgi:integrase